MKECTGPREASTGHIAGASLLGSRVDVGVVPSGADRLGGFTIQHSIQSRSEELFWP